MPVFAQDNQPASYSYQLAFLAIASPPASAGVLDLYSFPQTNSNPIPVVVQGYPLSASWSPDGKTMAFIMITGRSGSDAPPSDFDIYRIENIGTGLSKLTDTPECPEIGLVWPAGSQFLFYSGFCRDSQATTFWRLDVVSGASEKLGEVQWDGTWAVWSPDATKVALLAPRKSEDGSLFNEVNLASPDGQGISNLVDDAHPGYQLQQSTVLAWSPQGDWLAYATKTQNFDQGDANQIVLVKPDGSERKVLHTSQSGRECMNPLWSPDGQMLAFTCADNLFTILSDGTGLKNLTGSSNVQVLEYPTWSPDGGSLAFISLASDGKRRLEIVNVDASQRLEIAQFQVVQTFGLVWNPVANPVQLINASPDQEQVVISPTFDAGDQPLSSSTQSIESEIQVTPQPGNQVVLPSTITSIWILGLLLVIGGAGIFFLLRQAGKLPDVVKPDKNRENRSERLRRERLARVTIDENLSAGLVRTEKSVSTEPVVRHGESGEDVEQPDDHEGLLEFGIQQVRSQDVHGGIATLRQYLELAPDDHTAWLWLGWASALIKEYRTAERCFLRAGHLGSPQAAEALEWLSKQR